MEKFIHVCIIVKPHYCQNMLLKKVSLKQKEITTTNSCAHSIITISLFSEKLQSSTIHSMLTVWNWLLLMNNNLLISLKLKAWYPHVLLTEKETLCTKCGQSVVYCAVTLGGQGEGGPRAGWVKIYSNLHKKVSEDLLLYL